jgi:hypothetical protein
MLNLRLGFLHCVVGPEGAAAGYIAPLACDSVVLDVGSYGGDVLEFEFGYVAASVEEERLAMSAVLLRMC